MAQELFKISDDLAVNCNPNGRFHGWLFRRHPDGQFVSVRKLETIEPPNPFQAASTPSQDGGEG